MSIESVMLSNHLILYCPVFLLPSISPSVKFVSSKTAPCIRWPKYWSFSFSISPSSEYSGLISFRVDWFDLLAVQGLSRVFFSTTVQKPWLFNAQPSLTINISNKVKFSTLVIHSQYQYSSRIFYHPNKIHYPLSSCSPFLLHPPVPQWQIV